MMSPTMSPTSNLDHFSHVKIPRYREGTALAAGDSCFTPLPGPGDSVHGTKTRRGAAFLPSCQLALPNVPIVCFLLEHRVAGRALCP